jgi:hypothetical protein
MRRGIDVNVFVDYSSSSLILANKKAQNSGGLEYFCVYCLFVFSLSIPPP